MTTSDESFRSLCEDLAVAEDTLKGIEQLPAEIRAERRMECESWIAGLTSEVERALRQRRVIALGPRRGSPTNPDGST